MSTIMKAQILILFLFANSVFADDCLNSGGNWKKLCLVKKASQCLKWTNEYCALETEFPVTRPLTHQGELLEVYIDKEWNHWSLKGLFYQLARDYQKTNKTEMLIAEYYGMSLLTLRGAMRFAKKLELELCGTHHSSNDGADAVRHFAFSSYLSYYEGRDAAGAFLAAHETLTDNDLKTMRSFNNKMNSLKMDYINNQIGIEFASRLPFYLSKRSLENDIRFEVESKLDREEFFILKAGNTACDR